MKPWVGWVGGIPICKGQGGVLSYLEDKIFDKMHKLNRDVAPLKCNPNSPDVLKL